jgi:hypothetical protein
MRTDPKSIIVKEESSHHQDDLSAAATLPADSAQDVDPAAYSRCRANLTSSTFPQLHKWTQSYLPLLQSVVKADNGVFNAILLVAHLPDKSWGEKQWFCNSHRHPDLQKPEKLVNPEDKSMKQILILQCDVPEYTALSVVVEESPGGRHATSTKSMTFDPFRNAKRYTNLKILPFEQQQLVAPKSVEGDQVKYWRNG